MIVEREYQVGDLKQLKTKLLKNGFKTFRYFKKAKSVNEAIMQVNFQAYLEMDKPALYFKPIPIHDAPFVLQLNQILTEADSEIEGNQLIDIFIFKHLKMKE